MRAWQPLSSSDQEASYPGQLLSIFCKPSRDSKMSPCSSPLTSLQASRTFYLPYQVPPILVLRKDSQSCHVRTFLVLKAAGWTNRSSVKCSELKNDCLPVRGLWHLPARALSLGYPVARQWKLCPSLRDAQRNFSLKSSLSRGDVQAVQRSPPTALLFNSEHFW